MEKKAHDKHDKYNGLRFIYLRDPKEPRRVATIAWKWKYGKSPEEACNEFADVIISYCISHPSDQFSKKIARNICVGRMNTNLFNRQINVPCGHRAISEIIYRLSRTATQPLKDICRYYDLPENAYTPPSRAPKLAPPKQEEEADETNCWGEVDFYDHDKKDVPF